MNYILLASFLFFQNKSYPEGNLMFANREYLVTENPMIIYDANGKEYSVLPSGVSLYPENNSDEYIIYINYQPRSGELEPVNNNTDVISELYLSEFPENFNMRDTVVLTPEDFVRLLKKNKLSKTELAEVIKKLEE